MDGGNGEIYQTIKALHQKELDEAVQAERERVHKILGREFSKLLGTGQPQVTKLLLKLDREICNGQSSN